MRIAYVYDAVYPWVTGGVEKRVWELATRLADDHDVHWYGLHYWDGPPVMERAGVTLHGVTDPPADLYTDGRRSISEALSFAAHLGPAIATERFDVIDCQEFPYFPIFACKLSDVFRRSTLLVTWHEVWGDYWYEYLGRKGVAGKMIERLAVALPSANIAVSERTRRDVMDLGASTVPAVPNGIAHDIIRDIEPADRDVEVLFVGRFIPEKNVSLLVEALAVAGTNGQSVLLGDGPEHDRVTALVDELGLGASIELPGFLSEYEDVLALMKAADVFVLPSEREGFGISVLEALACGTPVVTVDHPRNAATELVDDGTTGAVCEPAPEAIAGAIGRCRGLDTKDCIDAAAAYDWDAIADRAEREYRSAVRSGTAGVPSG
jgi:glycosyltransferase involved in cell wall biosynthesis